MAPLHGGAEQPPLQRPGLAFESHNLCSTLTRHDALQLCAPSLQGSTHLGQSIPRVLDGCHVPQWPGLIQDRGNSDVINTQLAQIGRTGPPQVMGAKIESRVF